MKKNMKKKRKKGIRIKNIIHSEKFLLIIFCIMIFVVLLLSIMVFMKYQKEKKEIHMNMVIPIKKDSTDYHFSISAKALEEKKYYYFKVTNYQNDEVSDSLLRYRLNIENSTNSVISFVKEGTLKELMIDQKNTEILGNHFEKNKKEEVIYRVEMLSSTDINENDFIRVSIVNEVDGLE